MIDNFAIVLFSSIIVYIVLRAVKLDKVIPWFSSKTEDLVQQYQRDSRNKNARRRE